MERKKGKKKGNERETSLEFSSFPRISSDDRPVNRRKMKIGSSYGVHCYRSVMRSPVRIRRRVAARRSLNPIVFFLRYVDSTGNSYGEKYKYTGTKAEGVCLLGHWKAKYAEYTWYCVTCRQVPPEKIVFSWKFIAVVGRFRVISERARARAKECSLGAESSNRLHRLAPLP